ncbi:ribosome-binding factor A [Candidatus Fermentibacteria bacterium]|nr:MAG: ribosome-binding factor A [Candidatus Fermentibacteria bacterium]
MNSRKVEQLSGRIRMLLADILSREISDPRLSCISVNRVELASDGSFAKIFVSSYSESDLSVSERVKPLKKAAGYIRHLLSRRMEIRTVPELRFIWDDSVKEGEQVLSLLRSLEDGRN